jgi:thiol-disulfide isomerase/thioredoxin
LPGFPEGVEGFNSKEALKGFERNFPNSIYIPHLRKLQAARRKPISDSILAKQMHFIDTAQTPAALQTLAQQHFPGKYVFVDMWATWCQPCIKEFQYSDTLYNFLKANNVELLYLSIDNPAMFVRWKEVAKEYGLRGYHALVTKQSLMQDLQMRVYDGNDKITVPQYLLLNKDGNIISKQFSHPSAGQQLWDELQRLLHY